MADTDTPAHPLSWRTRTVIRILLLVAGLIADNPGMTTEIEKLATHISVHG